MFQSIKMSNSSSLREVLANKNSHQKETKVVESPPPGWALNVCLLKERMKSGSVARELLLWEIPFACKFYIISNEEPLASSLMEGPICCFSE